METFSVRVDTFMANILFLLFIWPFSAFLCEFISRFFMFPCCHFPFHFVLFFNNPQFTYFLLLILTITPPVLKPQSTLHFGDPNKMDKIQFSSRNKDSQSNNTKYGSCGGWISLFFHGCHKK